MQKTIKSKLDIMRRVFEEDPFNLVIGDIVEESSLKTIVNDDLLQDYYLFLNEYSSIRCGVVIIFGRNELQNYQFPVADMPGEHQTWLCIGKVEPYPLFINKTNGQICCLISEPGAEEKIICYGDINNFLDEYMLGEKYPELGGEDEWYDLLKSNKLI
ncbi:MULTISPECIES: hypothetical protein [Bacillales]|uniref:hypothetical protein n=1 Tax=Bacillales TaxID=1385 RepID=UPI000364BFC2|nr:MULTISPECIES: hypothetical protein [Bacillales]KMZ39638.1 hypothetical protein AC624_00280 [Bacillus sp. FJAT-27238]